jgi:hypothetical protein
MVDGEYQDAENLGAPINSDGFEFCPWISPGGDYLIYTLMHRDRRDSDLMISFRQEDGSWSEPENLGDRLGLEGGLLRTSISPDGKFLFFLGQIDGIRGAVWVDAGVIEQMRGGW